MEHHKRSEPATPRPRSTSMHDNVPIWDDEPCCCEPEPRWQAVGEELEEAERARRSKGEEADRPAE